MDGKMIVVSAGGSVRAVAEKETLIQAPQSDSWRLTVPSLALYPREGQVRSSTGGSSPFYLSSSFHRWPQHCSLGGPHVDDGSSSRAPAGAPRL